MTKLFDHVILTTYIWDDENRLVAVQTPTHILEFGYDDDGIRFYKTVNGIRTDFLIDSNQIYQQVLQESDAVTGTLIAQYTYGHDLLAQHNPTYGPAYYHYDAQLSTRFLTDPAANMVNTYEYSASGPFLTHTSSLPNPFTYTGEYFDPESSLLYLRARYYSLDIGRFTSYDQGPIFYNISQATNRYVYCMNKPEICIDFNGKFSIPSMATTTAIIGIATSLAIEVYFAYKTFKNIPPDAFKTSPNAGLIGYQVAASVTPFLLKRCGAAGSLCYGIAAAFSLAAGLGGVDVLLPFDIDNEIWLYTYVGIGMGFYPNMYFEDISGLSLTGYVGLVWNIEEPEKYSGKFWCTSIGFLFGQNSLYGFLARYGRIGPGTTICSSWDPVEKTYGPYLALYGEGISTSASGFEGDVALSSSLSTYSDPTVFQIENRPHFHQSFESIKNGWEWFVNFLNTNK